MTDKPVFDNSITGELVLAERNDEPGNENFRLRTAGADGGGHGVRRSTGDMRAAQSRGRLSGDWSWHPERDARLGDKFVTYKPPKHPLDGIRFNTETPINAN